MSALLYRPLENLHDCDEQWGEKSADLCTQPWAYTVMLVMLHFVTQVFMLVVQFSHGVSDGMINEGHFDCNWRSAAAEPLVVKPL